MDLDKYKDTRELGWKSSIKECMKEEMCMLNSETSNLAGVKMYIRKPKI